MSGKTILLAPPSLYKVDSSFSASSSRMLAPFQQPKQPNLYFADRLYANRWWFGGNPPWVVFVQHSGSMILPRKLLPQCWSVLLSYSTMVTPTNMPFMFTMVSEIAIELLEKEKWEDRDEFKVASQGAEVRFTGSTPFTFQDLQGLATSGSNSLPCNRINL